MLKVRLLVTNIAPKSESVHVAERRPSRISEGYESGSAIWDENQGVDALDDESESGMSVKMDASPVTKCQK